MGEKLVSFGAPGIHRQLPEAVHHWKRLVLVNIAVRVPELKGYDDPTKPAKESCSYQIDPKKRRRLKGLSSPGASGREVDGVGGSGRCGKLRRLPGPFEMNPRDGSLETEIKQLKR